MCSDLRKCRKRLNLGNQVTEYKVAKELFRYGRDVILSEDAQRMKEFTQHGDTSVFEHTVSVAKHSLLFAMAVEKVFGKKVDRKSLVRGALLHDYFLYDWHEKTRKGHNIHGFTHPGKALENARRDFEINDIEADIIKKHMFPLTLIPPKHFESFIVCMADKWCAICETFKIDISSYIIYRVNLRYDLESGKVSIGQQKDAAHGVRKEKQLEG